MVEVEVKVVEQKVVTLTENKIRPTFRPDGILQLTFTNPVKWNMTAVAPVPESDSVPTNRTRRRL